MAYKLEGRMIEACTCAVICPCWVGHDPDGGKCDGTIAWHFDSGDIDGTDVSGLTLAVAAHIPGNPLDGNWRAVVFVDDKATEDQQNALLAVYTGEKGGPVADLVQVIGEVAGVERAPITFESDKGNAKLHVGSAIAAETEGMQGATGGDTALTDAVFSSVPGAPAYVAKTKSLRLDAPPAGVDVTLEGKSAIITSFSYQS